MLFYIYYELNYINFGYFITCIMIIIYNSTYHSVHIIYIMNVFESQGLLIRCVVLLSLSIA